jgi:hypothetical protein
VSVVLPLIELPSLSLPELQMLELESLEEWLAAVLLLLLLLEWPQGQQTIRRMQLDLQSWGAPYPV